jgi:transcription elongation factor Elf1
MAFLNEEVEGAYITQKIRGDVTGIDPSIPTTAAFHDHIKLTKPPTLKPRGQQEPLCVFCDTRGHWAQGCKEVTDIKDRTEKLKLTSRCFLCLNHSHSLKNCSKKGKVHCSKCRKSHNYFICNADQPVSTSVNQIDTQSRDFTHLQTACIWITGLTGFKKLTCCLLDSGSQSSFIHTSLVDQLHLPVLDKRDVLITPFESTAPTLHSRQLVQFTLQGIWAQTNLTVTAFESAHGANV